MSKTEAMIGKVKALINAPSCCAEAKEAANKWLEAVNTEKQDEAAKALIEEIAADIIPIDGLIAFAGSEDGKKIFGEEKAAGIEAHAKKIKAEGARFCDCPACTAVAAILADKADLYAPTYSLTWTVTDDMTAKRIGSAGSKILSTRTWWLLWRTQPWSLRNPTSKRDRRPSARRSTAATWHRHRWE